MINPETYRQVLSRRHTHQYEQASRQAGGANGSGQGGGFLNAVRSISDIGRTFSHGRNLHKTSATPTDTESDGSPKKHLFGNQLELPKVGSLPKDLGHKEASQIDLNHRNSHFMVCAYAC